jgi:hypothetical protein
MNGENKGFANYKKRDCMSDPVPCRMNNNCAQKIVTSFVE